MKSALYSLVVTALVVSASSAMAEKFLGGASGSIEKLRCYSTFEGQQKDYVTIAGQERNTDGYVDGLQLKGKWYDINGIEHFAIFDVIYVSGDDQSVLIVGKSPQRNSIELNIPTADVDPNLAGEEATLKINGVRQDFLKFSCDLQRAG